MEEGRQVLGGKGMKGVVEEEENFGSNAELNRKPYFDLEKIFPYSLHFAKHG